MAATWRKYRCPVRRTRAPAPALAVIGAVGVRSGTTPRKKVVDAARDAVHDALPRNG